MRFMYRRFCSPSFTQVQSHENGDMGPKLSCKLGCVQPRLDLANSFGEASKLEPLRPVSSWMCLLRGQVLNLGNNGFSPGCSLSLLKPKTRYCIFWNLCGKKKKQKLLKVHPMGCLLIEVYTGMNSSQFHGYKPYLLKTRHQGFFSS